MNVRIAIILTYVEGYKMITERKIVEITGTDERGKVGDRIISVEDLSESLRNKRKSEREMPGEKTGVLCGACGSFNASFPWGALWLCENCKKKAGIKMPVSRGVCKALRGGECYFVDNDEIIERNLRELKKNEPTSDNELFRLAIINYELGDLNRAIVYANRFRDSDKALFRDGFKNEEAILAEGKLAMADLLTMLNMLCITMNWDFTEMRKLGMEHLKEREKDFKRDDWSEVK